MEGARALSLAQLWAVKQVIFSLTKWTRDTLLASKRRELPQC